MDMDSDAARDAYRRELMLHRQEKKRGRLKILTPKVADEAKRAKWFGAPPSQLETPKTWRAGGPVAF